MQFDKEFKEAISHLPDSEKNKLILRLLKKDKNLFNRLYFELVSTDSIEDKREQIINRIECLVDDMTNNYYSVGYLHSDVRMASGEITQHVSTTKDKFGSVSLNILLINRVLEFNNEKILKVPLDKARKFVDSVIARAFRIVLNVAKLDQDYFVEFQEGLIKLGGLISKNKYLMDSAVNHGFNVNWLLSAEIPEDIAAIYKVTRQAYRKPQRFYY